MTLPPEVIEDCIPIALGMAAFWLVQPFVFQLFLVGHGWVWRLFAAMWFGWNMYYLADGLREALGEYYSFNVNLIWWIFALTSVKIVHAVLDPNFGPSLGLTSFGRIALFCYLPCTVIFDAKQQSYCSSTTTRVQPSFLTYIGRGLLQLVLMGQMAQLVLDYRLDEKLPEWAHALIAYYQILLSQGGFSDLVFATCSRLIVGSTNNDVYLVEPSDVPVLATVPRYFWARWSKSAGFHLRRGIYDQMGGRQNQVVGTLLTFAINCVLHITWWGYVSAGRLSFDYTPLLLTIPIANLFLDKYLLVPWVKHYSTTLYHILSWLLLQAEVVYAVPKFLNAQGLPSTLHELCLVQTGKM